MNFLSICQRLKREARISGASNTPATVVSQTGEMLNLVEWVQAAYQDVQNEEINWDFLLNSFTFQTIAATSTYTPIAASLPELLSWRTDREDSMSCYLTATGVADQQYVREISWDEMNRYRYFGSNGTQTGRPLEFAIKPNNSIIFWPIPSAAYTIVGEYYKQPQSIAEDADIPIFPAAYHMILVWLALRYTGAYQSAPEKYAHGDNEYRRLMNALRANQLPINLTSALE